MDEKIVDQILDDLYSFFEDAETQSTAILLFLKGQGIATEEQLAPYFEQAGRASDVRWRAARVRMASLLASAMKPPEAATQKQPAEQATEKQNIAAAVKDKNSGTTTKAEASDAKQKPSEQKSEQKSETVPARKSEQASEQKSRQASEQESGDGNKTEKDAA